MNITDVVELMKHMKLNDISLVEMETDGTRLRLEKKNETGRDPAPSAPAETQWVHQGSQPPAAVPKSADIQPDPDAVQAVGELVTAPVVGVFYAASAPDSDPFVAVGVAVEAGTTVCIIEAMKLMNEVTCKIGGIVREILVQDGQRVEYGQPLMRIEQEAAI